MPKISLPGIKSPAARILALKKNSPGISARDLREVSQQAVDYLREQLDFISGLKKASEKPIREARKLDDEIAAIHAKSNKTEAEYTRLVLVEKMAADFNSRAAGSTLKAKTAEDLLDDEINEWQEVLLDLLSNEYNSELIRRATKAVAPFSLDRSPLQVARNLPAVMFADTPKHRARRYGNSISGLIQVIEEELKK